MSLIQDLRFALRLIAKERWFATVAVAALALGIGVNATVFTLVNAVLVRGLPFKDSHNLYMIGTRRPPSTQAQNLAYPDLQEWRAQTRTFESIGGFGRGSVNIADDQAMPEQARNAWVTANAFRTLGQQPLLGRDFAPEDDRVGAERVVIIGYSLWQNRYGGQATVLGRILRINGEPATIIGVMPEGMMFPTDSQMWMPFVPNPDQLKRDNRSIAVFGRLRADSTRTQAQAEMDAIARGLAAQFPDTNKEFNAAIVQTFNERFNGGEIRQVFLAMMGAVGFVLLIACANVANLLLSRAAHRSREVAVRMALGASRWRVVRQLLVESIVLGFMGGAIGILLSMVGTRMFDAAVEGSGKPYWIQFTIDWVVIGYVAAICILTGVLFGLAPALQVSRTNVNEVLKEGGRGTAGNRRAGWMSGVMVVVELALTIVLLVGAALMVRSFLKLYSQDIGFRTENLMQMRLQLPEFKYPTADSRRTFYDNLLPKLAAVPGAESVALATALPPAGGWRRTFEIEGRPLIEKPDDRPGVTDVTISPAFFDTLGVRILRGRALNANDGAPGFENIVVSERFVSEFFPGDDPIGKRIRFPENNDKTPAPWRTIVGISGLIRYGAPQDSEPRSVVYLPLRQQANAFAMVVVRSRAEPGTIMSAVRQEVKAIDPDQPVFTVQTLDAAMALQRWPMRVFGAIFAIFAFIALVMSSVGLYAVMAYSVTQRTQEIGVRMALGAEGKQVRWLILRRGLIQLAIGLTFGLTGAYYASEAIRPLLVQVTPNDPITLGGIAALLSLVSIAACLIPATRATRLDPLTALRID
jgi:putative ABC transport system permease protein